MANIQYNPKSPSSIVYAMVMSMLVSKPKFSTTKDKLDLDLIAEWPKMVESAKKKREKDNTFVIPKLFSGKQYPLLFAYIDNGNHVKNWKPELTKACREMLTDKYHDLKDPQTYKEMQSLLLSFDESSIHVGETNVAELQEELTKKIHENEKLNNLLSNIDKELKITKEELAKSKSEAASLKKEIAELKQLNKKGVDNT